MRLPDFKISGTSFNIKQNKHVVAQKTPRGLACILPKARAGFGDTPFGLECSEHPAQAGAGSLPGTRRRC